MKRIWQTLDQKRDSPIAEDINKEFNNGCKKGAIQNKYSFQDCTIRSFVTELSYKCFETRWKMPFVEYVTLKSPNQTAVD